MSEIVYRSIMMMDDVCSKCLFVILLGRGQYLNRCWLSVFCNYIIDITYTYLHTDRQTDKRNLFFLEIFTLDFIAWGGQVRIGCDNPFVLYFLSE